MPEFPERDLENETSLKAIDEAIRRYGPSHPEVIKLLDAHHRRQSGGQFGEPGGQFGEPGGRPTGQSEQQPDRQSARHPRFQDEEPGVHPRRRDQRYDEPDEADEVEYVEYEPQPRIRPVAPGHSRPTLIKQAEGTIAPKFCGSCGKSFLGKKKCECGWKPPQSDKQSSLSGLAVGVGVALIALVVIGGFTMRQWYYWYPDKAAAQRHFTLANDLFNHRQFEQAESEYTTAEGLDPNRSDIHYRFSWNLLYESKQSNAADEMRTAATLSPNDEKMQAELGEMLRKDHQYDAAVAQFAKCEKAYPQRLDAYLLKEAITLREANKPELALPLFAKCSAINPTNELSWSQAVACYEQLNDKVKAIAMARKGLKSVPGYAFLHFKLGSLLAETNKTEAIEELKKSAELDPSTNVYIANLIDHIANNGAQKSYLVPLRRAGQNVTTEVVVNGKIRLVLIVDSGAETCIIPTRVAKALGIDLALCPRVNIRSVTGTSDAALVNLKTVKVGAAQSENIRAMVYDYADPNADGLLGMTFLENYVFSIDAQRQALSLTPKNHTMNEVAPKKKKAVHK